MIRATLLFIFLLLAMASPLIASTVNLWEHEKDEDQRVLDELIADFEKTNKSIKIRRSHYKTEDLRTQFQTAALGGGGADLVIAPNDFAGPFAIMQIIQPVETFIDAKIYEENVIRSVTDKEGKIWGLPVSSGNHLILFANKKMVGTEAPETVEDMVTLAKKLTDASKKIYGLAYHLTEPFWFVPFMDAHGKSPLFEGKAQLDHAAMIQALELVRKFKFDDKIVPPDCDYTCAETLFIEGKAAMTINGDWAAGKFADHLKGDLIIAPLPKLKATGKYMAPMVSGKFVFFNSRLKGKPLQDARKFADFLASKPVQLTWMKKTSRLPALKAVIDGPEVKDFPIVSGALAAAVHGQAMPMDIEMRAIWDAIRPQLQRVMSGRAQPKVAAAAMQRDAEAKIREMRL